MSLVDVTNIVLAKNPYISHIEALAKRRAEKHPEASSVQFSFSPELLSLNACCVSLKSFFDNDNVKSSPINSDLRKFKFESKSSTSVDVLSSLCRLLLLIHR